MVSIAALVSYTTTTVSALNMQAYNSKVTPADFIADAAAQTDAAAGLVCDEVGPESSSSSTGIDSLFEGLDSLAQQKSAVSSSDSHERSTTNTPVHDILA